ncbi:MAG: TIGR02281 family clan AA aspartic protease [Pseudomonadota bacterium]
MTSDQTANLIYLVLLGLFAGSYFLFDAGRRFSENLKLAVVWLGVFVAVIAGYNLLEQSDARQIAEPRVTTFVNDEVVLRRARDGHFYVTIDINDAPVKFVVDTGASLVVLNEEDASRVGYHNRDLHFSGQASTANGRVRIAPITIEEVTLAGFTDRHVRGAVNGGRLDTSLLGMSYLNRFEKIEISGAEMKLIR